MAGGPINWLLMLQPTVAVSSMEAEYMYCLHLCYSGYCMDSPTDQGYKPGAYSSNPCPYRQKVSLSARGESSSSPAVQAPH
jgi:hypothetical protein